MNVTFPLSWKFREIFRFEGNQTLEDYQELKYRISIGNTKARKIEKLQNTMERASFC